ncbi:MAG: UDP-2,3-diacylglucosamine diphosphatase LpxI [Rhodospirillales bacterium]
MPRKLGILAGGGRLPDLLIQSCRETGRPVTLIAFAGHADGQTVSDFAAAGGEIAWRRLGNGSGIMRALADQGVEDVILAGSIRRPGLLQLWPDFWSLCLLLRTGALAKGDDGLLRVLIAALTERNMRVVGVADVAPELLTPAGCLTRRRPDADDERDIAVAKEAARELGRRDVGQAAVARYGAVIAEETRSGTDAMMAAIHAEGAATSGVMVKCFKPQQDPRVDLPTIGPDTVAAARRAGLRGIAVDAGRSLIVDREDTVAAANQAEVFIVGMENGGG